MIENEISVFAKGDKLYTDSREVAKMIDKRHDHLVRDIDGYINILEEKGNPKIGGSEFFVKSTYTSTQNKQLTCYLITKKGCEFVANKLTGEKGILFTATYINAFHDMEEKYNSNMFALPKDYPSALRELANQVDKNNRLKETNAQQQQLIEEQKPKVNYYDIILSSKNAIPITQIAKDYGKTAQWMNEFLHKHKVQFKQGKTWLLYKDYATQGYTKSETYSYLDYQGESCSSISTKWTQKGRLFIYDLLKHDNVLPLIDINNSKKIS